MPRPKVAIIGGGVAGLAAAVTLTQTGVDVTLFETNAQLGGRAKGVQYQGHHLDNGQHILLGAYHETLRLLALTDVTIHQHLQRIPLHLKVFNRNLRAYFQLRAPSYLPAPFHILAGLMWAKGISYHDKWCAIRMMIWLKWHRFQLDQDIDLAQFLIMQRQTKALIDYLWEPLCLAALNTPIKMASAQVFLNVLRDSFNQQRQDADMLLANTDLTSALSRPLADFVKQHGGQLHTAACVTAIEPSEHGYLLKVHDQLHLFSHVIIATGPHQLKSFMKSLPLLVGATQHFTYQPITTVYLQYAQTVGLNEPMLGMVNSLSQWVFDRGQICGQHGLMAVVISAHNNDRFDQTQLAAQIHSELSEIMPLLDKPLWHKVITEKRATFSCDTNLNRPDNKTNYKDLYIAGDYTAGNYPATIEGAVRSGIAAANLILAKI